MVQLFHGEEMDLYGGRLRNEDGIYLDDLEDGDTLEVETQHHCYRVTKESGAQARISGHPRYCPEPVTVEIEGSTRHGWKLKPGFIGRGMRLTFDHPKYRTITTSRILDVHQIG